MNQRRTLKSLAATLALLVCTPWAGGFSGQQAATTTCSQCAVWNVPQKPFKIYGNTYYVAPTA